MYEQKATDTFTPEQEKQFDEAFSYSDKAEVTTEEYATLREMLDTPEKYRILRKILQVYTAEERGVTYQSVQSLVQANETDLKAYGLESAIQHLAYERVRQSLLSLYMKLQKHAVGTLKDKFKEENTKKFEEEKRAEEFKVNQEKEKRTLGENL